MQKYVVLQKEIGQTPLECAEAWRATQPEYKDVPLAYAGRLDPMASGKLLVLIGEECKRQSLYHGLDKTYEFEVLFGVTSDSGDVLGLVSSTGNSVLPAKRIRAAAKKFVGDVTFPYPKFSSKTVKGKPLHTWTLEGRIHEIEIPTYMAKVYKLALLETYTFTTEEIYRHASEKIETIAPVTDERKAIGNDFRRADVRVTWKALRENRSDTTFTVARFSCTCSSGTYMRTLAEVIAAELGTSGLAYSIHRTKIGKYLPLPFGLGVWLKQF